MQAPVHNVGGWTARWARTAGSRPAVVDRGRRLDYIALEDRVARAAGWLAGAGVRRGDRVGLLLANRSAYFEVLLGAARIGAIALPINSRFSPREIRFLLDDCEPAALVHEVDQAELVGRACDDARKPPSLQLAVGGEPDAYETALAQATPVPTSVPVSPDAPMMLMYTSGTTGSPKGALLPHRKALFNSLNAQLYFGIRADDRVLVAAPLFHSLGLQILSLPALYCGAAVVLQRHFDPAAFWRCVEAERIRYAGGVPTMYQRLEDELVRRPDAYELGSLRFLFTAGAAAPVELIRSFERRGLVLKQGYGQTETSTLTCLDGADARGKAGSVGRPVFHADVRVVPVEDLAEKPPEQWRNAEPDETGEIVVRGPITMLGYWERPDETAETLRGDWLRTGDLARVDDEGFITLVGRSRDMYISGGENVYPAEVESVYAEHPAVREIAVVPVPDPEWGEAGRAHVVVAEGAALDAPEMAKWGAERLARFKVPRDFIRVDALPRTASGKVQKHLLAAPGGSARDQQA